MRTEKALERGLDWTGLPVVAAAARLLCRTGRIRDRPPATDAKPGG